MAASDAAPQTGKASRPRRGRSVLFYALVSIVAQLVFLIAAVVFVSVGSANQVSAIDANTRAQQLQLLNQAVQRDFLDAQRSLRGYQTTGQQRFLQTYHAQRLDFVNGLRQERLLAAPDVLPGLDRQTRSASTSFRLYDAAVAAPRGSAPARNLTGLASTAADQFLTDNDRLQAQLGRQSAAMAAQSRRSLGIGLLATSGVLVAGLMIPVLTALVALRRGVLPLQRATDGVLRLAAGEHQARVAPGGTTEIRRLGESINFLAGESDRMRAELEERAALAALARDIGIRVREHLDAEGVIRESATVLRDRLKCEHAWVLMVGEDGLYIPVGNPADWGLGQAVIDWAPPSYLEWLEGLYRDHASYCVQDLGSPQAQAELPRPVWQGLRGVGAASLLLTPFGVGPKLLGEITLVRTDVGRPWTAAEIGTLEAVATDIGRGLEHAMLYAQQKELVTQLRTVDRAKSNFLASVTHDLRSPLTGIIGNAEMLGEDEDDPLSQSQRRMLASIDRNAIRLSGMIEDLLAMSRIELGAFEPVLRPVDFAHIVLGAVDAVRASASEKGLGLELACPDEGLAVAGDASQLDRAVTNLLTNAVKYTPTGGFVSVTAGQQDGQVVLTVRDTGIGIPAGDQPQLFTRFFRASNAVTRAIPGTGLGLAIVRAIVDNHGGEVTLESEEGTGTAVTVRLPMRADGQAGGKGRAGAAYAAAARRPAVPDPPAGDSA